MSKAGVIKSKPIQPFTMVPNTVIDSNLLSLQAKGMYAYLMSKPVGWVFSVSRITSQIKESKNTVNTILNELEEFGLLGRVKVTDEQGKYIGVDYDLYGFISYEEPSADEVEKRANAPKEKISVDARKKSFGDLCKLHYKECGMTAGDVIAFHDYWTQINKSGTKMAFELPATFEIKPRMRTWVRNKKDREFTKKGMQPKQELLTTNT